MPETQKDSRIEKRKLIEENLIHYSNGTEQYYKIYPNILITDGIKFICDTAQAYWLIDIVFSLQSESSIKNEPFQVYELEGDLERKTAELKVSDGNENDIYSQNIPFTDFPLDKFRFYYTDNVVLLPSEY